MSLYSVCKNPFGNWTILQFFFCEICFHAFMVSSVGCGALDHVLVRVYKNVIVFGFKLNVGYLYYHLIIRLFNVLIFTYTVVTVKVPLFVTFTLCLSPFGDLSINPLAESYTSISPPSTASFEAGLEVPIATLPASFI